MSADCKIVGQKKLTDKVDGLTMDTFPHSLLLIGESGCGKHTLCRYISARLNLPVTELGNNVGDEDVEEILFKPYPCLYLVNLDNAIPKLQNNLLKVMEEPPAGAFMIGVCTNGNLVLPTLANRCQKWRFDPYSREELGRFVPEDNFERDLLLETFTTPGQLLEAQGCHISQMKAFCDDLLDRLWKASLPIVLAATDKLAFKDEKDKYNVELLVKMLNNSILGKVKTDQDPKWIKVFGYSSRLAENMKFSISKQRTFEKFLLDCRRVGTEAV